MLHLAALEGEAIRHLSLSQGRVPTKKRRHRIGSQDASLTTVLLPLDLGNPNHPALMFHYCSPFLPFIVLPCNIFLGLST